MQRLKFFRQMRIHCNKHYFVTLLFQLRFYYVNMNYTCVISHYNYCPEQQQKFGPHFFDAQVLYL